jgi:hypothetical protein
MFSFYSLTQPVEFPPHLPVPGKQESPETTASEKGASYMSETFTALCRFWSIVSEFMQDYTLYSPIPVQERVSLTFAHASYHKLLAWADGLPPSLHLGPESSSQVHILQ